MIIQVILTSMIWYVPVRIAAKYMMFYWCVFIENETGH